MGATHGCVSKANMARTPTAEDAELPCKNLERLDSLLETDTDAWVGEWTYMVKNEVHSFDILVHKGKLVYSETMGGTVVLGRVVPKDEYRARIICKKMKFEIDLNREDMVARYRTLGTKKWTKKIDLMKVDEIEDETTGRTVEESFDWNRDTLKNTWRNTGKGIQLSDTHEEAKRTGSIRGASYRKMQSLKLVTAEENGSATSSVDLLFKQNSTRRSIRFEDEEKADLVADLLASE